MFVPTLLREGTNGMLLTGVWCFCDRALQVPVCRREAEVVVEVRATGVLQEER